MLRQRQGRRLSHIRNSQREQQARQRRLFALLDGGGKLGRALFPHPLKPGQRLCGEAIEVRRTLNETGVDELIDDLVP